MCGISGYIGNSVDTNVASVSQMVHETAHRGPDGSQIHLFPSCILGFSRLAIRDVSSLAMQPMRSQSIVIEFNGEIYNTEDLLRALNVKPGELSTGSDTEVLLRSLARWGLGALNRLNGIFAFAAYDLESGDLILARDRFGVKPLYYYATKGGLYFASEMKAFQHLPTPPGLNAAYVFAGVDQAEVSEQSMWSGVRQLRAGHHLRFRIGGQPRITRWYQLGNSSQDVPTSYSDRVGELRDLIDDAVLLRLKSDRPVALSVSGGLDSSTVLSSVAANGHDASVKLFFHNHLDPSSSEFDKVQLVTQHLRRAATDTGLSSIEDVTRSMLPAIYHGEDANYWPVPIFHHYMTVREHGCHVSIDGHGGDEVFGGYDYFLEMLLRHETPSKDGEGPRRHFYAGITSMTAALFRVMRASRNRSSRVDLSRTEEPSPDTLVASWLQGRRDLRFMADEEQLTSDVMDWRTLVHNESQKFSFVGKMLYESVFVRDLPWIMRTYDRLAMASAVEVREPLLDHRVVQYAFALPDSDRIDGDVSKKIMRDLLKGRMPDSIRQQEKKLGFGTSLGYWLARGLRPWLVSQITAARLTELIDPEVELQLRRWCLSALRDSSDTGILAGWRNIQGLLLLQTLVSGASDVFPRISVQSTIVDWRRPDGWQSVDPTTAR